MNEWKSLMDEAEKLLQENPSAGQVIVLQTEKGSRYHFLQRNWDSAVEERFLDMLAEKENVKVLALVCMWKGFQLDVPSMSFRRGLLARSGANGDALVLLQGATGVVTKKLGALMP